MEGMNDEYNMVELGTVRFDMLHAFFFVNVKKVCMWAKVLVIIFLHSYKKRYNDPVFAFQLAPEVLMMEYK